MGVGAAKRERESARSEDDEYVECTKESCSLREDLCQNRAWQRVS